MTRVETAVRKLLDGSLAIRESGVDWCSTWFYGDREPGVDSIIRAWADDHADKVRVVSHADGFAVEHRGTLELLVTWYPTFGKAVAL